jgi:DNA adenine methylase
VSFIRYPGSKSYLNKKILPFLEKLKISEDTTYVEPFAGSFAIGLKYLANHPEIKNVWINDKNYAVAYMWQSIKDDLSGLQKLLYKVKPSSQLFYQYKQEILNHTLDRQDITNIGFRKIALHRWSYSGYGEFLTAPQGGKRQTSQYKINMIWNPNRIYHKLRRVNKVLRNRNVKITHVNFKTVLSQIKTNDIIYLDPPQFHQKKIYQLNITQEDHSRLLLLLNKLQSQWILSYDVCPEVYQMYSSWAKINEINVSCQLHEYMEKYEYLIHK